MPHGLVKYTLIATAILLSPLSQGTTRPADSRVDVDSVSVQVQGPQLLVETSVVKVRLGEDAARGLSLRYNAEAEKVRVTDAVFVTDDGERHALTPAQIRDIPSTWALSYPAFAHVRELILLAPIEAVSLSATVQRTIRESGPNARVSLLLAYSPGKAQAAAQANVHAKIPAKVYSAGFEGGKQADGSWQFIETGGFGATATLARVDNPESPRHVTINAYAGPVQAALAYHDRTASATTQTLAMQNLADQIAAEETAPRLLIDRIAQWSLANIKRVEVPLDLASRDPRAAGQVVTDGYGSPDDIVTVMRTLLQAKGINAVPVLTSTQIPRDSLVAGIRGIFTDVMLYVPALDLYVDSAAPSTARAGATLARRANAVAFVAGTNQAGAYLQRLPGYEAGALIERTTTTILLSDTGESTVTTKVMPAGYAAVDAQSAIFNLAGRGVPVRTLFTQSRGGRQFPRSMELKRNAAKEGEAYSYGATASFGRAGFGARPTADVTHALAPIHGIDQAAFSDDGVELCRPGRREESLTVHLPDGGATSLPQDASFIGMNGGLSFVQTVKRDESRVFIERVLTTTVQGNECNTARREVADFARRLRGILLVPVKLSDTRPVVAGTTGPPAQ